MPSRHLPPPRVPTLPGGLSASQRAQVEALVENALQEHAKQTAAFVEQTLRDHFSLCVELGLYTPDGLERLKARQAAAAEHAGAEPDDQTLRTTTPITLIP